MIASLYLIGLAASGVVLNDWIEGCLVPSEGAMLILVFACIAGTIRLTRQRYHTICINRTVDQLAPAAHMAPHSIWQRSTKEPC